MPFWKLPMFMLEESASRIQIYERLQHWVGTRNHAMKVAICDTGNGEIVGYCELGMSAVSNEAAILRQNVPMIGNLVVLEQYRKRGIGSALLSTVESIAREWGHNNIAVTVMDSNERALSLYVNKCGYRRVADLDYTFKDMPSRYVLIKDLK